MEPALLAAVSAIHASPSVAVIATTGGASQAVSWLLGVPGASRTVLEAVVPYSRRSFIDFVRSNCKSLSPLSLPEQFVSPSSAALMAQAAYNRALVLSPPGRPVVGVACTCALATSAPKKGMHRCHVAARSQSQLLEYSLHLTKASGRGRWQEDELASRLLIRAVADVSLGPSAEQLSVLPAAEAAVFLQRPVASSGASGTYGQAANGAGTGFGMGASTESEWGWAGEDGRAGRGLGWTGEDSVRKEATAYSRAEQLQHVLDGVTPMCVFAGAMRAEGPGCAERGESKQATEASTGHTEASCHSTAQGDAARYAADGRRVVLSGSFNPLHHGHTSLMEAALQMVPQGVPCYEIPAVNADKGRIPVEELERRVLQFTERGAMVVVTGEPLFAAKAALLPDSSFVVGYDTAVRLIDPKYYGNSLDTMEDVLLGMGEHGCSFIVAPRLVASEFKTFDDLQVPAALSHLFSGISDFRVDISSTQIRNLGPNAKSSHA